MSDLQGVVDCLSAQWQRDRAKTQMTLGEMIQVLESMPDGAVVANLRDGGSYRGYCCDFAFAQSDGTRLASELLAECKSAMGQVFEGYKGGDYVMGALTPVWVADYGRTGQCLIAIHAGGLIETAEED